MSGIAGIIRFDGGPAETALVREMAATMAARGPDGSTSWSGGPAALAHLALHSTPESLDERQPLVSADGQRVLVVDGRIDNRDDLAMALAGAGARPLDSSDAALFLAAYEAWGDGFADRIEGDFALVVWDARRRAAICVRDRFGVRPLHWHLDGGRLAFASDLRPVLELPWVDEVLDEAMLAQFLADDFRSWETTFWRGVRRLAPGHRMIVTAEGADSAFYWCLDLGQRLRYRRREEYVEHYRALLDDVVRRMSRSHRPLAFEVSGGLDSSALFAVADDLERRGDLAAPGIRGYTLHLDDDSDANELAYARAVAAHLGRPVHEIEATRPPLGWYLAEAGRLRDFPGYPNGEMAFGLRRAAAAAGCRALVNGTGGDEVLTGDRHGRAEALLEGRFGDLIGSELAHWQGFDFSRAAGNIVLGGLYPLLPAAVRRHVRRLRGVRSVAVPNGLPARLARALDALPAEPPGPVANPRFENHKRMLRYAWHPSVAHTMEVLDRMLVRTGIELRPPYLNAALIRFHASVPDDVLLRGGTGKHLHRSAMRGLLPDSVVDRRTKAEFSSQYQPLDAPVADLIEASRDEIGGRLGVAGQDLEACLDAARDIGLAKRYDIWYLATCLAVARSVPQVPANSDLLSRSRIAPGDQGRHVDRFTAR